MARRNPEAIVYAILELSAACRQRLLAALPPALPVVVCDHVTLYDGPDDQDKRRRLQDDFGDGWEAVGVARGGGVVALVVAHRGSTAREIYDGGTFHCTHSLAAGHDAAESNAVIARNGWEALLTPLPLEGRVRLR